MEFDEELRELAKYHPADVSAIGIKTLISHIEELEAENKSIRHILSLWKKTEAMKEIDRLTAELAELRERTRWIPVSERLPEKYTPVLTVYSTRHGSSAHAIRARVEDDKWYSDTDDSLSFTCNVVTHWMPLPEPPEAD